MEPETIAVAALSVLTSLPALIKISLAWLKTRRHGDRATLRITGPDGRAIELGADRARTSDDLADLVKTLLADDSDHEASEK